MWLPAVPVPKPADVEAMRMQNNREAVLVGVRDDKTTHGPAHAPPAHSHAGR